jgi:DNA (cytosine-5)-methyltransferase 3A
VVGGADGSFVLQRRERKEEGEEKERKLVKEKPLQERKKLDGQSSTVPGAKSEGEGTLEKKRKKKKKHVDFSSVDLNTAQLVGDLRDLALEQLYGKERDAAPVRYLVLNFRSGVYQKSLANQAAPGKSDVATAEKLKLKKEKRATTAVAPKPLVKKQGLKKLHDSSSIPGTVPAPPSVIGRKRSPSDRQEELNVKKQKKMDKIKSLALEKKTSLASATKVIEEERKKETKVQKPELPPAPKVPSPTALMMKFPMKTALPTIATLKAKLARFGQIDISNTRVYWNSHMCKVTFRYKDDAKAALSYVNSNEMFGQSKVQYYIRELDYVNQSQEAKSDSWVPVEPALVHPGSRVGPEPTETRSMPSLISQPPKSILKKPGEESGASAGAGNGPRVTFMLDRKNSKPTRPELPSSMTVGDYGGGITNKSAVLPPPPPLIPHPLLVHSTRPPYDVRHIPPPPPLLGARPGSAQWAGERRPAHEPVVPGPFDPIPSTHNAPFGSFEEKKKEEVDIPGQLLGLLRQCSDIVAKVKNSLGYMPYHPL